MEPAIIYACVNIVFGLVLLLFGVKFMKAAVSIIGFLAGFSTSSLFLVNSGWSSTAITLTALAIGLILGFVAFRFYRFAVTLSVAYFFATIAYTVAGSFHLASLTALAIAAATGIVGLIVLKVFKIVDYLFAFITAAQGAIGLIASVYVLVYPSQLPLVQHQSAQVFAVASAWWLAAWVVLTILGVVYQKKSIHHE